jgi:hypothetical protein
MGEYAEHRGRKEAEQEIGREPAAGGHPPRLAGHPQEPLAVQPDDGENGTQLDDDLEGLRPLTGESQPGAGHDQVPGR